MLFKKHVFPSFMRPNQGLIIYLSPMFFFGYFAYNNFQIKKLDSKTTPEIIYLFIINKHYNYFLILQMT